MRKYALLLSGFILPILLPGQSSPFVFRNISINEGLSQSSVVDIAIDSAGFIWLATQDGLNRFDGNNFVNFQKSFDDITTTSGNRLGKLLVDGKQNLWFVTSGGKLERMDLVRQVTTTSSLPAQLKELEHISCIAANDDQLWIGTGTKGVYIYHFQDNSISTIDTASLPNRIRSNTIHTIFIDNKDHVWVLSDSGTTTLSKTLHSVDHTGPALQFAASALTEDKQGTFWLGSFGKGLFIKQKDASGFVPFRGFPGNEMIPEDLTVEALLTDESNRIWVGTYGKGLFVIDPQLKTIHHLTNDKNDPFSLSYNDVLTLKKDGNGGIWIGTDGGGISYFDKRLHNFKSLTRSNLPASVSMEQVRSVTTDSKGDIWVGTSNSGLAFIKKDYTEARSINLNDSKTADASARVVSLYADKDNDIWIGVQGTGLLIMDGKTRKIRKRLTPSGTGTDYFPDHTIWCLLPDQKGRVWAGTRSRGLCLVDKYSGIIKTFNTNASGQNSLLENNIRALCFGKDNKLVIGFETKGIQYLDTSTLALSSPEGRPLEKSFTGTPVIRCLFYQSPYLWIGTYGRGLACMDLNTGKLILISTVHGLPNNTIYGVLPEADNILWLSTNKGICRFRIPTPMDSVSQFSFNVYTAQDGLQSNEFNTGAYFRSNDGRLFFGGINGLSIFVPATLSKSPSNIPVRITEARVDNQPLQDDTLITYKKHLDLSYSQNSISFSFAAIDVISAGRINYFYQLAGYDDDWIDAGTRNYAAYTNLQPGEYIFRVKTSRDDLSGPSEFITSLTLRIRPPYWKTWWFISLVILAIGAILYGIYRYRISQLMQLQKVRNNIASDLHDDIGSTLTNISMLSELSRKSISQEKEATVFLDRISEEVQHSGQALDDIVWSINTNNDTLEQTIARMRRYAAEVFDAAGINYVLEFEDKFANRKINMEQRRDFLLLFKETVNNIYKHADAKNVRITTGIERNKLFMRITDDGKGFNTSAPSHRNGIKNMQQRISKWEGFFSITSTPGKGTLTEFNFYIA